MCPSCHSNDVSRSRRRKLKDSFMRWMGKVAYRCRDCQKRFYLAIDVDRRLRSAEEWRRRSEEHASASGVNSDETGKEDTPEEADSLGL